MDIDRFRNDFVRSERRRFMPTSLEMTNKAFLDNNFGEFSQEYFFENASEYIYTMRATVWKEFLDLEKKFTANTSEKLVAHSNTDRLSSIVTDSKYTTEEKVTKFVSDFIKQFDEYLYALHLSNTQSRRSRAGNEFEYIIYKLLAHANFQFDDQGMLGNERFESVGLGKLVDIAVPGVVEYNQEKHKCALISMKTTLRERWQEVPEELNRTGAQSMYLLTLDEDISGPKIDTIYGNNVHLVVPDKEKEAKHKTNSKVYGMTEFLYELDDIRRYWARKNPTHLGKSYYEEKIKIYNFRKNATPLSSEKKIYESYISLFKDKLDKF
ncbi:type II restriction endonuclease [Rossellomorea aquimaris]|uniref:type II restriction endonuclease n=1 Tax=Rossellomorea aquimaris TaxID=189382 RepID=UPI000695E793|nr:type II restriction endonuclease [Rossellomorea aquimaris]